MDKSGGSSRLISRRTGGDSDVDLDKSSKKEKLRRLSSMGLLVGEMDQLSHSINTNSTTNRVKVLKKFPNHSGAINHACAPRKLRSAMTKRDTKKHKSIASEFKDSKTSSVITKDEEEVAEALFALAQATTPPQVQVKPPSLVVEVEVEETMPPPSLTMPPPIPSLVNAPNRCSLHVYICSFIKLLQTKTNPTFDSLQQHHSRSSKQHLSCNGNWQSQRHDRMPPVSGSIDKGKMQLSHGYDNKGGLFFVT